MDILDAQICTVNTTKNSVDVIATTNAGGTHRIDGIACTPASFAVGQWVQIVRPNSSTDWRILTGGGGSGMWRD